MKDSEQSPEDRQRAQAHQDEILRDWCTRLLAAHEIDDLEVDIHAVLGLAGRAAHTVLRPAAPLTTFIAGYAAGQAAAQGSISGEAAVTEAFAVADRECREQRDD